MKRLITIFLLSIQLLFLSSCSFPIFNLKNNNHSFKDYQIEFHNFPHLEYYEYKQYSDIEEDINNIALYANIQVFNKMYRSVLLPFGKEVYGSGVIFYESENYYYALTNHHVVKLYGKYNSQTIKIVDGHNKVRKGYIYEGSLNSELDLAIIVIEKNDLELSVLELVDEAIKDKEKIIAIGNPENKRNVITLGEVRGYEQISITYLDGTTILCSFKSIKHTAKINSGSSGGMLINYNLQIVGINFASSEDKYLSLSYAIPSRLVVDYLTELNVG